jgi:hypothetical protein
VALLATAALRPSPAVAQVDSTPEGDPLFEGRDAWTAAAFLGATALAFPFDERIAVAFQDSAVQHIPGFRPAARVLDFVSLPGTLVVSGGLYAVGRLGRHDDLADVGLHMGEAIVVAEALTFAVKVIAGRARPELGIHDPYDFRLGRGLAWDDTHRSFPSGHTSAAFAAAAVAARELDRIHGGDDVLVGFATYGPATFVGLSRVFDNRHWASDVIAGAAIGAFAGWKVVRYSHSHPGNRIDDWFLAGSVVPGHWSTLRLGLVPAP